MLGNEKITVKDTGAGALQVLTNCDTAGSIPEYYKTLSKTERQGLKVLLRAAWHLVDMTGGQMPIAYEDEHLDSLGLDDKT